MPTRHVSIPAMALELCGALPPDQAVWLVGGAVRDLYLGRAVHDLDLVVPSEALALGRQLAGRIGGAFVPLDTERGCARIVLAERQFEIDIADFRAPDLAGDLAARDFSLNALAVDLAGDGAIIDPTGGLDDLDGGIVRLLGREALIEDPLRGLRGVRIAAQLGFRLDDETRRQIRSLASTLIHPAAERVREELIGCVAAPSPATTFQKLEDLNLLQYLIPEVSPSVTPTTTRHFDHMLQVLEQLEEQPPQFHSDPLFSEILEQILQRNAGSPHAGPSRSTLLRLAAVLHDVGKTQPVNGEDHAETGAVIAETRLKALRFGRADTRWITRVVRLHTRPTEFHQATPLTRRFLHRFLTLADGCATEIGRLMLADLTAKRPPTDSSVQRLKNRVLELLHAELLNSDELVRPNPLLTGHQILAANLEISGPQIGALLAYLLECQVAGEIDSPNGALELAKQWLARGS